MNHPGAPFFLVFIEEQMYQDGYLKDQGVHDLSLEDRKQRDERLRRPRERVDTTLGGMLGIPGRSYRPQEQSCAPYSNRGFPGETTEFERSTNPSKFCVLVSVQKDPARHSGRTILAVPNAVSITRRTGAVEMGLESLARCPEPTPPRLLHKSRLLSQ